MKHYQTLIKKAKQGFKDLPYSLNLKKTALNYIKIWLSNEIFSLYIPNIIYIINNKKWELLFDSFCRVIPFGTGGRRGLVGIGSNRVNVCTIKLSAQGFSQYLIKKNDKAAYEKGIVLGYDVRECLPEGINIKDSKDKVNIISSFTLAESAACVYVANGIKVYFFKYASSTPILSFAIRYFGAIGGCMFSASHNSPQYNGEKFYDHFGSQFIPPDDHAISCEIQKCINKVQETDILFAESNGFIQYLDNEIDQAYYDEVKSISLRDNRDIKILYSPLHGTGLTSVFPILLQLGFDVYLDDQTSNLSGSFENVTFNLPNPEVKQSFDCLIKNANLLNADIILSTDPDADRLGIMVHHKNNWVFLTGDQIGIVLTNYILTHLENHKPFKNRPLIIKTIVTTSLIDTIAHYSKVKCISDLLVGFKYISNYINTLCEVGLQNDFLLGIEESHGYLVGTYCRDKDASGAAVWISELAATLKQDGLSLIDYINSIYSIHGYCHNYLTEIRLIGINGLNQINHIMNYFRVKDILTIGDFKVKTKIDRWEGFPQPHLSRTDTSSRNIITFIMNNLSITKLIKLTIRPSGTEPKLKIYIEIFGVPFNIVGVEKTKDELIHVRELFERSFLKLCYSIIDVKLPERSFLMFDQIALYDKLRYFELEEEIIFLKDVQNHKKRRKKLIKLLSFLGINPIDKVDRAFSKKYGCGILAYLGLKR